MKKFILTNKRFFAFLTILMCSFSVVQAQIFEPEGLNLPGTWNGFTNPPVSGSVFGSSTQVAGGQVNLITTGTRRWQASIACFEGGDVAADTFDFLFTSGATATPFANKWAGVNVVIDQLQNYTFNSGADNRVILSDNKFYTINWRDAGYQNSSAIFMETSAEPVVIDSVSSDLSFNAVTPGVPIEISAYLSGEPSPEEIFYLRYSVDGFANSVIVPMDVSGSEAFGLIPGFNAGAQVFFYVFSSTVPNLNADFDMHTLRFLNDEGLNFTYTVVDPFNIVDLGADINACPADGPWTIDAGAGFTSYNWSTGATTQTITVSEAGEYSVVVFADDLAAFDTINVNIFDAPTVDLGANQVVCGSAPIILNSGYVSSPQGDSLTIIYDATMGQSTLANLPAGDRVYMHSSYESVPFGGPVEPWVGNWGQDDGLGAMTSLGNNLWSITIPVYEYYNIQGNDPISGLFIVFRNEDGTRTGKDDAGNDIFLNLQQNPPISSFSGISGTINGTGIVDILWSTGATTSSISIDGSGTYSVQVTSDQGCGASDEVTYTVLPVPVLTMSEDTSTCGTITGFLVAASSNFATYSWSSGQTTSSFTVNQPGTYVVTAVAANGCVRVDSVQVRTDVLDVELNLADNYSSCGNVPVVLDPGVTLTPQGDSLTIVYNTTLGQTGLIGATSVYMHSSYEFAPLSGAVEPWVGNWGQDDGIGQMTNIGNNLWSITINVYDYYNVPSDSLVNGLFMVFRNADGTQTGKDNNGNDIFLNLTTAPPSSTFSGVTATVEASQFVGVLWSNGSTEPIISVTEPGVYDVVFFGQAGCNVYDTLTVTSLPAAVLNLGADRILCNGSSIDLNAGNNFNTYDWSTGDTTSTISINEAGSYSVSVVNASGCSATDVVNVLLIEPPVANFTTIFNNTLSVTFIDATTGPAVYSWDFDSDGDEDLALNGTVSFTYPSRAEYTATLIVTNLCGADTFTVDLDLRNVGFDHVDSGVMLNVYPNPAQEVVYVELPNRGTSEVRLLDASGRIVQQQTVSGELASIQRGGLPYGFYLIEVTNGGRVYREKLLMH
jgi:hypothetical protein